MAGTTIWRELSETLRASAPYRRVRERLGRVAGMPTAAAAWLAELLRQDLGRPLLVVVPRESDAMAWLETVELLGGEAVYFPAPSLSPYQQTEISLLVRAQEAAALGRVAQDGASTRTVVATPRALFRRLPTPAAFAAARRSLAAGMDLSIEELIAHLAAFGYHRTDLVTEVGELAVRGGVVDVFPPGGGGPVRLDLFGDTIESIRLFDPQDQRSLERLDEVVLLPLSLFRSDRVAAGRLADRLEEEIGGEIGLEVAESLAALRERGGFAGWENYLPVLEEETVALSDYLVAPLTVAVDPLALELETGHHHERLEADHRARGQHRHLALPPERLEHPAARVREAVEGAALAVGDLLGGGEDATDFHATSTDVFHGQLPRFPRELETARARRERLLIVTGDEHRGRVEELCRTYEMTLGRGGVELVPGVLQRGFRLPAIGAVIYGELQLFPRPALRPLGRRRLAPFVSGLRDLKVGDFVVHEDHGIGQFVGLRSVGLEAAATTAPASVLGTAQAAAAGGAEVMEIAYREGRRLLVPLSRLDQVQKYSGIEGIAPRLDQLGGNSWSRTKARVKKGIRQMAGDLLRLYAERQLARAPAMLPDSDLQAQFEAAFDFEETPDQLEAIVAIKEDLQRERPMDRLLCGDVGFGKTEVAMRAAYKVAEGGHQVAVLAPTTILADQHLETFRRRFAGFPVTIDMISRFRSPAESKDIRERLAAGRIDIIIGTHRLIGRDLEIPRLGLLVVDEEQRFGVAQKERFKQLRKNVHVLAMSATPVPRTLQLSLAGVRDLSVIETPPKDRMAVETAIMPFSAELVREAIEFELERKGQVFYVYNRVESIERLSTMIKQIVPGLRVTVGHGQLPERELELRMHAFARGEHDLLLATTIIENGIDLPNVNTIIVHRADRFGLAQLYQLRGRVGRSDRLAYCYLLVPADRVLSEDGRKRLAAIREFSELGAGFRIAARDLEIRGAGDLLGAEQSGHIAALGVETYLKMLEDAVRELKGEVVEEAPSVALDLPVALAIPADYIREANLRMEIYRKIASGELGRDELLAELTDRFGAPPPAVQELLEVAELKRLAERLRVQSISARGGRLQIRLRQDARVDVERLIALVSVDAGASFSPTGVLTLSDLKGVGLVPAALEILGGLAS